MKKNNVGFTLIEVLIALAILGIALTAIIRATTQNIKDNHYLQNKTIATWVGTQVLNEARVNVLKIAEGDDMEDETEMFNQTWPWLAHLKPTINNRIKKVDVTVYDPASHDELVHLETYIYVQP